MRRRNPNRRARRNPTSAALPAAAALLLTAVAVVAAFGALRFRVQPRNTTIYWAMLAVSAWVGWVVACSKRGSAAALGGIAAGIAAYATLFFAFEMAYFAGGVDIWSEEERVGSAYRWFDVYLDAGGKSGGQADLTDGYFPGEERWWDTTTAQAIRYKFDALFDALALAPGMRVLDVGCGYGAWMEYLRDRGVESVGLTLSVEQMRDDAKRGLEVHVQDIVTLPGTYAGRFDAVSMLGSLEHFCKCHWSGERRRATYRRVLANARAALRPDSASRRIAVTALVMPSPPSPPPYELTAAQAYIIDRHYSGRYPPQGELDAVAQPLRLTRTLYEDHTEDYRWTSIVNPAHFGNFRIRHWDLRRILYVPFMFLTDPFAAHKWLYHASGVWMRSLGGSDATPDRARPSPCRLKWEVWTADFELREPV